MYLPFLVTFVVASGVGLLATALVRRWARRIGFLDHPVGHKQHAVPVALGGGIALAVSICGLLAAGALAAYAMQRQWLPVVLPEPLRPHLPGMASRLPLVLGIVAGAFILHVVGLIDDRKALGPLPKLAAQVIVAVFTAWVLQVRVFEFLPTSLAIACTVVWIVLVTNAFNFLDNMDGLSAGVAAIGACIFALAGIRSGQVLVPLMAGVIAGGLCGFLWFNLTPASIFMGDAGSLVVGYLMSVLAVLTTFYDPSLDLRPVGVLVPLIALAVPLYDVVSVVTHRIREGVSPFRGDWRHFSHRLVKRGMSRRDAVLTIYLATAATGLPAIVLPRVDRAGQVLLMIQCVCVVVMIAVLEHTGRPRDEP
jgi:UDP-GlcNAc:undecaprenyl-phosphate GlcNAc-1-phosphate transferase